MVLLLGGAACAYWEAATANAATVPPAPVLVVDGRKHVRHKDPPRYYYPTAVKPQNNPIYWPYPTAAGALLLGLGVWRQRKANDPEGVSLMNIPQQWDEAHITREIQKFGANKSLASVYIGQLKSRFVDGMEGKAAVSHGAFLEKQNELLKVGIENIQLKSEAMRTQKKEGNKDLQVDIETETLKAEASLQKLKTDLERENILTEIARKQYERSTIGKEPSAPAPPPAQKTESASEIRERERVRLKNRMREIREEVRLTEANPNLGEEEKQRFINILEDRIAGLEGDYGKLL
jgi:hypothetical protein